MPSENYLITTPNIQKLGNFLLTIGVQELDDHLSPQIQQKCKLFASGDWGDLCEEDWQANIETIKSPHPGGTLMGAYKLSDGTKIWIITSGYGNHALGMNHCYTTVLLPSEY